MLLCEYYIYDLKKNKDNDANKNENTTQSNNNINSNTSSNNEEIKENMVLFCGIPKKEGDSYPEYGTIVDTDGNGRMEIYLSVPVYEEFDWRSWEYEKGKFSTEYENVDSVLP